MEVFKTKIFKVEKQKTASVIKRDREVKSFKLL